MEQNRIYIFFTTEKRWVSVTLSVFIFKTTGTVQYAICFEDLPCKRRLKTLKDPCSLEHNLKICQNSCSLETTKGSVLNT